MDDENECIGCGCEFESYELTYDENNVPLCVECFHAAGGGTEDFDDDSGMY